MTPEQFKRVREIFEQALESDPADIGRWLDARGGEDPEIRREVAALLNLNSRAGSFLSDAVVDRVPDLLAEDGALEPGARIGTYTIEREIGRGGMGHVYLAKDSRLGRMVAVKALPPRLVRDLALRERLRREAQAAGALSHPGICTVYALEEVNGDLFIVSEYVEGHTLREEISRGRPPSGSDVRETARELASALASAHAKGITHRDLKPENVMRTTDGRLKILDFGLARFDGGVNEAAAPRVTQPGAFLGTPAYMAPEQLKGQPADARADVFAFGVLIYEYACGVHPFEASSAIGVAARVLESDVQPLDNIPAPLAAVIARCLRKSPAERFASAGEIVSALAREESLPPRRAVTVWWRRHQLVAVGLYLMAAVLGWQIKEWQHGLEDSIFLWIGVAATVGGVFRGHLMFTEQMNRAGFTAERLRARPVLLTVDLSVALAVGIDGVLLASARPLPAVLILALAVGIALASIVVEPATAAAAFPGRSP